MKLIKTEEYLLLVDENAQVKNGDHIVGGAGDESFEKVWIVDDHFICDEDKKVVAYYPLTDNEQELSLPLLPYPFGSFKPEYNVEGQCNCICHEPGRMVMHAMACCHPVYTLKTRVNSQGKEELIGTYIL